MSITTLNIEYLYPFNITVIALAEEHESWKIFLGI